MIKTNKLLFIIYKAGGFRANITKNYHVRYVKMSNISQLLDWCIYID